MYSGPQKRFVAAHCKHELDGVPGNCLARPFVVNYRKETGGTLMGLCQATCPHCRTLLLFPQEWRGLLLRCKTCLQVFRETNAPIPTGQVIPAAGSPTNGGTVPGGPVEGRNNLTNFSPPNGGAPGPLSSPIPAADQASTSVAGMQGPVVTGASTVPVADQSPIISTPAPSFPGAFASGAWPPAPFPATGTQYAQPANSPSPYQAQSRPAPPPLSTYEELLLHRRRVFWIKFGVVCMTILLMGLVLLACWPYLQPWVSTWRARFEQALAEKRPADDERDDGQAPGNAPPENTATTSAPANGSGGGERRPKPGKPGKRDFDGRALLIGIQNYFYLNPVNTGALMQKENEKTDRAEYDPLGFRTFRRRLINMGFRNECIGELSDVAEKNPNPPLKASIEETLKLFLEESRPQDSIVIAYVGHVLVLDDKVFLAPIDAKLNGPPEKLIPLDWVYQQLGQCKARHKLLILDVAHLDPQEGVLRGKEMPLDPAAEKAIAQPPEGVLVWLSCSAKQFSYSFGGYGLVGSVFFHMLTEATYTGPDLQGRRNRQALEKAEPFPEWDLPLLRLAKRINGDVVHYIKSLGYPEQEPKLIGKLGGGPAPAPNDPLPAAVTLKFAPLPEKPVEAAFVDLILQEVGATLAKGKPLRATMLPPFWAKDVEKYKPDYQDLDSLKATLADKPLRKAVFDALALLDKHERSLRMSFLANANVEVFRKEILHEQENLAIADQELFEFKEKLDKVRAEFYEKETPRWQANFDLVYARYLGRLALYREYNFVLGNKLRKDPTLQNPEKNNGWKIVPSDKMQQKETRDLARERDKVLERILKEHPGTPWEFLAERERATSLGLKVEEARVN